MNAAILIAAPSSGCGKTTFTMGLLRAMTKRGLRVQPYKCGPDYIDTLFHQIASGRESVNLDTFMASSEHIKNLFSRYSSDADVCVIEGAMGLYDGYDKWHGSAFEIASLLDLPIVLVADAKSVAYSVAALLHGIKTFRPINLAGVVFNRVGSERHYHYLTDACEEVGVRCFGYLPNNSLLQMPSRHLGLNISGREVCNRFIDLAAKELEDHVDIEKLISSGLRCANFKSEKESVVGLTKTIAVARDDAFNFTYRANLDSLAQIGKLVFFSPLNDSTLPSCDLLYLPGGYPELYASELSANSSMRGSIKAYAERGGYVVAECGGFMYLCSDIDGVEMCGVFPFKATMEDAHLHLGYRQMTKGGVTFRGHEFHYSSVAEGILPNDVRRIMGQSSALGKPVGTPIYRYKNVISGYTHWYWAEKDAEELSFLWRDVFLNA